MFSLMEFLGIWKKLTAIRISMLHPSVMMHR